MSDISTVWVPALGRGDWVLRLPGASLGRLAAGLYPQYDAGTAVCRRASSGTFVDVTGVVRIAPPDQPRVDYAPVTHALRGLLVENEATNILLQGRGVDSAGGAWALTGALARVGKTAGPDLSSDATVYTTSATTGAAVAQAVGFTANTPFATSVWARLVSGSVPTTGNLIEVDYENDGETRNVNTRSILAAVTATGAGAAVSNVASAKTYQASGTVTSGTGAATVQVQGSNDGTTWDVIGTLVVASPSAPSQSFNSNDRYFYVRGVVTSLSGTGAAVSLNMGFLADLLATAVLPIAGSGLSSTWQRFSVQCFNRAAEPACAVRFLTNFGNGAQIALWGGDTEVGTVPSSTILTDAGPATRTPDFMSISAESLADVGRGGDLVSGNDLQTAMLISLFTDRIANTDDVISDASDDPRGWWADAGQQYPIGSRLWLLERDKQTDQTRAAARDYIAEALQWLIDDGVVARFDIVTEWLAPTQLGAGVTAFRKDGTTVAMNFASVWQGIQ